MRINTSLIPHTLLILVAVTGCVDDEAMASDSAETSDTGDTDETGDTGDTGETGETGDTTDGGMGWPSPDDAPSYDGDAFVGMQIYDVEAELWLDELALMEGLDPVRLVFVGEQHETAAIHELQRWVLERLIARHGDVALAMEHFQSDEQAVIDDYLSGVIDSSTFEATSDPWSGYAMYWKQLVETMKSAELPVLGVNVPNEALESIYAAFPSTPLEVFNAWDDSFPYDPYLPPRPLAAWDATYQGYFEGSFDYESHGKDWGLSYQEALDYFTALALIRDDTMGFHIARHLDMTADRVVMVGGDWHVQTGLATPDSVVKFTDGGDYRLITTATPATFESVLQGSYEGRAVADFILVYDPL